MATLYFVCILFGGLLSVYSVTAQLDLGDLDLNLDLNLDGGCRCKVVDNRDRDLVLRDFGRVLSCGDLALGLCGCGRVGIRSCRSVCEAVVETWAANTCPVLLRGREVRAIFHALDCADGRGDNTHDCDGRGLGRLVGGIGDLGDINGIGAIGGVGDINGIGAIGGVGVVGGLRLGGVGLGIRGIQRAGFLLPLRRNLN